MAYFTRERVKEIIDAAPTGTTPGGIVAALRLKGHVLEGLNDQGRVFAGQTPTQAPMQPQKRGGIMSRVGRLFGGSTAAFGTTLGTALGVATGTADELNAAAIGEAESRRKLSEILSRRDITETQRSRIFSQLGQGQQTVTAERTLPLKTTKQVVGEAVGTLGEGLAVTGVGRLIPHAARAAPLAVKVAQGAKVGALFGGIGGLGASLQENRSSRDVALSTGLGVAAGGAIGGAIPLVGAGWNKVRKKIAELADRKSERIYQNVLRMSPTELQREAAQGKNTPSLLKHLGMSGSREDMADELERIYDSKGRALQKVMDERAAKGVTVSVDDFEKTVMESLKKYKTHVSEYSAIDSKVKNLVENTRRLYGNEIPVNVANEVKSALWKDGSFNPAGTEVVNDAVYEAGSAMRKLIEAAIPDEDIAGMNRELGQFIVANKQLQKSIARPLTGKMSRMLYGIMGGIFGLSGGPLASIGGGYSMAQIDKVLSNATIRTTMATLLTKIADAPTPAARNVVEQAVREIITRELERGAGQAAAALIPQGRQVAP